MHQGIYISCLISQVIRNLYALISLILNSLWCKFQSHWCNPTDAIFFPHRAKRIGSSSVVQSWILRQLVPDKKRWILKAWPRFKYFRSCLVLSRRVTRLSILYPLSKIRKEFLILGKKCFHCCHVHCCHLWIKFLIENRSVI